MTAPRSDALRARLCELHQVAVSWHGPAAPQWAAEAYKFGEPIARASASSRAEAEDAVLDALGAPRDEPDTVAVPRAQVEALAAAVAQLDGEDAKLSLSAAFNATRGVHAAARDLLRSVGR